MKYVLHIEVHILSNCVLCNFDASSTSILFVVEAQLDN